MPQSITRPVPSRASPTNWAGLVWHYEQPCNVAHSKYCYHVESCFKHKMFQIPTKSCQLGYVDGFCQGLQFLWIFVVGIAFNPDRSLLQQGPRAGTVRPDFCFYVSVIRPKMSHHWRPAKHPGSWLLGRRGSRTLVMFNNLSADVPWAVNATN